MNNLFKSIKILFSIFMSFIFLSSCAKTDMPVVTSRTDVISTNWRMQSSEKLEEVDEASISKNNFDEGAWLEAIVPEIVGTMVV